MFSPICNIFLPQKLRSLNLCLLFSMSYILPPTLMLATCKSTITFVYFMKYYFLKITKYKIFNKSAYCKLINYVQQPFFRNEQMHSQSKKSTNFTETKYPFCRRQGTANDAYSQPDEFGRHPHILLIHDQFRQLSASSSLSPLLPLT